MAGIVPVAREAELISITGLAGAKTAYSVWSWLDGQLVIEAANDGQAYTIGKKCLEAGRDRTREIANPEFALKTLLRVRKDISVLPRISFLNSYYFK